jgi:surface antigen
VISPAKYIGQTIGVTGPDLAQCTAVCHAFQRDNGLPIVYGDAKDTFANAASAGYATIPYKSGLVPPAGSCVVWNSTWGEGSGHTAWVESATAQSFTTISQNDPTGSKVQRRVYGYSNAIIGFYYSEKLNQGDDMIPDQLHLTLLFQQFMGRDPSDKEVLAYVGKKSYTEMIDIMVTQQAYKDATAALTLGQRARADNWETRLAARAAKLAPGIYEVG